MDSDWVFNFDCNNKPTQVDDFFDSNVIPLVFYQAVLNRNKKDVYTVIKNNPQLSKDLIKFYQHNLAWSFNFKKSGKFGAPIKIKWRLINNKEIIMNFNDQVEYYRYIVSRNYNDTNMGFLIHMIKEYLSELSYGLHLIKNKNCGSKYYYRLGINVYNDEDFRNFIRNFV